MSHLPYHAAVCIFIRWYRGAGDQAYYINDDSSCHYFSSLLFHDAFSYFYCFKVLSFKYLSISKKLFTLKFVELNNRHMQEWAAICDTKIDGHFWHSARKFALQNWLWFSGGSQNENIWLVHLSGVSINNVMRIKFPPCFLYSSTKRICNINLIYSFLFASFKLFSRWDHECVHTWYFQMTFLFLLCELFPCNFEYEMSTFDSKRICFISEQKVTLNNDCTINEYRRKLTRREKLYINHCILRRIWYMKKKQFWHPSTNLTNLQGRAN